MSGGLNTSRFVGLPPMDSLLDELRCGICLEIFDTAVDTDCQHTFCLQCLHHWIKVSQLFPQCPECRKSLSRQVLWSKSVDANHVRIGSTDFVVTKNRKVNAIIGKLKITCDNKDDGCAEVIAVECLSAHLKTCRHQRWSCPVCAITCVGGSDGHDCSQRLMSAMKELETRLEAIASEYQSLQQNITELNDRKQELNDFQEFETKCRELGHKCRQLDVRCKELEKKYIDFKSEYKVLKQRLDSVNTRKPLTDRCNYSHNNSNSLYSVFSV